MTCLAFSSFIAVFFLPSLFSFLSSFLLLPCCLGAAQTRLGGKFKFYLDDLPLDIHRTFEELEIEDGDVIEAVADRQIVRDSHAEFTMPKIKEFVRPLCG